MSLRSGEEQRQGARKEERRNKIEGGRQGLSGTEEEQGRGAGGRRREARSRSRRKSSSRSRSRSYVWRRDGRQERFRSRPSR